MKTYKLPTGIEEFKVTQDGTILGKSKELVPDANEESGFRLEETWIKIEEIND